MKTNSEKNWQQLVAALAHGVIIINHEGVILYANETAADLFGRTSSGLIGENFLFPIAANEIQEIEILKPDSKLLIAEMQVKLGAWNHNPAWIISLRDITQQKLKVEQLEIASRVFNHAHEGIMVTDANLKLIDINPSLTKMLGYTKQELLGKNPSILKSNRNTPQFYHKMWSSIAETGGWQGEIWEKHKVGTLIPVFLTISTVKNQDNEITNYIGFCNDLILQKKQQAKISHMKYYDSLTNLPNQNFLSENLELLMSAVHKTGKKIVVIYISIDGLNKKEIDSVLTNKDKNTIIIAAANRISNALQNCVFIAHITYNAFVAVYENINTIINIVPQVQHLIRELLLPCEMTKNYEKLSVNIGITSYPDEQVCFAEELIRQAYLAAYEAKLTGENQYKFFDNALEKQKIEYNQQIIDIRHAIAENQLVVYYQPKINMRTGKVLGAEALLRLQHPQRGLLAPANFLPNIQNHPVSIEIGEWVLHEVLNQIEKWLSINLEIPVSINITPHHLQQANFISNLKNILAQHPKVNSHLIELEILETEVMENIDTVKKIINECKKIGILFSLDDFGTGYSTLAYLKELPANRVKLDQTFVRDIMHKPENITILKACITMCKSLRRDIIAEGVETALHGKLLLYLGCNEGQGYAISRAISAESFLVWLKYWSLLPEWEMTTANIKEGKILMNAVIGHFSSVELIKQSVMKEVLCLFGSSSNSCSLGRWFTRQIKLAKNTTELERLELMHNEIHMQAKDIIELLYLGNKAQSFKQLEKLESLSIKLLNELLFSTKLLP